MNFLSLSKRTDFLLTNTHYSSRQALWTKELFYLLPEFCRIALIGKRSKALKAVNPKEYNFFQFSISHEAAQTKNRFSKVGSKVLIILY